MPEHRLVQEVYDSLGPWARADKSGDLLDYVRALIEPLGLVDDIARDSDDHVGWGSIMDIDSAPSWVLPWLAQFVGVRTVSGLDDASQRTRIRETAGFRRGTPAALIAAAKQHLTGGRRVELYEREGGAWVFRLRTYSSETPNPDLVLASVRAVKPAGLLLRYELQEGIEIDDLVGTIDGLGGSIESYSSVVPLFGPSPTGLGSSELGSSPLGT